jgi:hypothetical protein
VHQNLNAPATHNVPAVLPPLCEASDRYLQHPILEAVCFNDVGALLAPRTTSIGHPPELLPSVAMQVPSAEMEAPSKPASFKQVLSKPLSTLALMNTHVRRCPRQPAAPSAEAQQLPSQESNEESPSSCSCPKCSLVKTGIGHGRAHQVGRL